MDNNKYSFVWELREPIEIQKLMLPDEIIVLWDFIKSVGGFTGTATELVDKPQLENNPSQVKKKIIKHIAYLTEQDISYSENRTFERREFSLCYDGNDTMTCESSPENLPSYPSDVSAS